MHEQEICCRGCGRGLTAFEHQAASTCAKCGRGPYCSRCGGNHAENCQKPFAEESWNCAGCDKSFLRSHADTGWHCPKCGERWLCVNCAETHRSGCPRPRETESEGSYTYTCAKCKTGFDAWINFDRHMQSCQESGFTCKICDKDFADLADYTMHATTCVRPETEDAPEVEPHRAPAQCFGCGSTLVAEEDGGRTCLKCSPPKSPKDGGVRGDLMPDSAWLAETPEARNQACHEDLNRRVEELEVRVEPDAAVQSIHARSISALERKAKEPKPGGNYGAPDIDKWFKLRVPTEQEAKDMDTLRATYTKLALDLEILCPEGADRMAALRLLKQSMHTAIGSIVTMDAWQTPKPE